MRLWLLRHAKSSWNDAGLPDEERPLAPRGERAADRMRDYIAAEEVRPGLALCSSALRARQTLASVLPALGTELEVRIEPGLYTFDADVITERLRRVSSDVTSVLLVGHNPAIQDLAARFAGRGERLRVLQRRYPTAALAEITFDAESWDRMVDRAGELVRFIVPKELDET